MSSVSTIRTPAWGIFRPPVKRPLRHANASMRLDTRAACVASPVRYPFRLTGALGRVLRLPRSASAPVLGRAAFRGAAVVVRCGGDHDDSRGCAAGAVVVHLTWPCVG